MTREVAIKAIQDFIGWFKEDSLIRKALEIAIQALSQEPCEDVISIDEPLVLDRRTDENTVVFKTKDGKEVEYVRKEPCDDAVSREAVLEAVSEGCQEWRGLYGRCEELINELPSVTQKSGKWLYKEITDDYRVTGQCSECKERRIIDNYCPNCGARMVEPQESEEQTE